MTVDDRHQAMWDAMQRQRPKEAADHPQLPLQGGGGGDNSGGMEARLAKLEASMDYVKADLARLAGVPAELARLSERVNHLPTKSEMHDAIETAIDRSSSRLQRTMAIVGGIITLATVGITYLLKLVG